MQNIDMTLVNFKNLENFVLSSFLAMGLRNEDAKIFTDALMFSELRFHSGQGQGVQRITTYYKRIKNKEVNINIDLDIVRCWIFTWSNIIAKMPYDWDVIQLAIICTGGLHVTLHRRFVNDFSTACYIISRHLAEKLI